MDNRHRSAGLFHWPVPLAHFHWRISTGAFPLAHFHWRISTGIVLGAMFQR